MAQNQEETKMMKTRRVETTEYRTTRNTLNICEEFDSITYYGMYDCKHLMTLIENLKVDREIMEYLNRIEAMTETIETSPEYSVTYTTKHACFTFTRIEEKRWSAYCTIDHLNKNEVWDEINGTIVTDHEFENLCKSSEVKSHNVQIGTIELDNGRIIEVNVLTEKRLLATEIIYNRPNTHVSKCAGSYIPWNYVNDRGEIVPRNEATKIHIEFGDDVKLTPSIVNKTLALVTESDLVKSVKMAHKGIYYSERNGKTYQWAYVNGDKVVNREEAINIRFKVVGREGGCKKIPLEKDINTPVRREVCTI